MGEAVTITSPWLTPQEVQDLTNRERPSAQLRQLKSLGFYNAVHFRTDGSFVVLRHLMEAGKTKTSPGLTLDNFKRAS